MTTLVAKLTHDHLEKKKGCVEFTLGALDRFFGGWAEMPSEDDFDNLPKTQFKLYDDDEELYYSGWLKDDADTLVQQFVLSWAMADSGCTILRVKKNDEWVIEIG